MNLHLLSSVVPASCLVVAGFLGLSNSTGRPDRLSSEIESLAAALVEVPAGSKAQVGPRPGTTHHQGCVFENGRWSCAAEPVLLVRRDRQFYAEQDAARAQAAAAGVDFNGPELVEFPDTFFLHSNPSATKTIYLDFDGNTTTGTSWNSSYGVDPIESPAYDPDGNGPAFTNNELSRIQRIWHRVAEDYAPFDLNVTTEDPGEAALVNSGGGDTKWGVRVVITVDEFASCGCGGFAYIDSFNWNYQSQGASDTPVFVFNSSEIGVSGASTHEAGHALGLSHDGTNGTNPVQPSANYYNGHGSGETGWGPIMGSGYYSNVTTWDLGEYFGANNGGGSANYGEGPDDIDLITTLNGFGFRSDDHGDSIGSASEVTYLGPNGTNPSLVDVGLFGVIEDRNDRDFIDFETGTGLVNLRIDSYCGRIWISDGAGGFTSVVETTLFNQANWPDNQGSNLDIEATLFDSQGGIVATSNPAGLSAEFTDLNLAAGRYTIRLDGVGVGNPGSSTAPTGYTDYASIGQYFVSGTVEPVGLSLSVVAVDANRLEGNGGNSIFTFNVVMSESQSNAVSVDWFVSGSGLHPADGEDFGGVLPAGQVTFSPGVVSVPITVDVFGDTDVEANETFTVGLTNASDGEIFGEAEGSILNDDAEIRGVIWSDANSNGSREGGEDGVPGITVYVDLNQDGVRDGGEPVTSAASDGAYTLLVAPGDYLVRLDLVAGQTQTAPDSVVGGVEPDDHPAGTVLNSIDLLATLTAVGGGVANDTVSSLAASYTSTGNLNFGSTWRTGIWNTGDAEMRVDFVNLASEVRLDYISDDSSDFGHMRAFNAAGSELFEYVTANLGTGAVETMTITRPAADIAYILASGRNGQWGWLDKLEYELPTINGGVPVVVKVGSGSSIDNDFGLNVVDPNLPPVADLSATPISGHPALLVNFDGSGSSDPDGTIVDYAWEFGDGNSGSGATPSHTYTAAGNYTATLTVTDDDGATGQNTQLITVTENEAPVAVIAASPTAGEEPLEVSFDASGSTDSDGTVESYAWDFGDGNSGSGAAPSHTYTGAGSFAATVTVIDDDGATAQAVQLITVTGNEAPLALISATPTEGHPGLVVNFDGSGSSDSDGTIDSYAWDFGDGNFGSGATPSHAYTAAGNYTATLTVTDDDGATGQATQLITVAENEVPLALISAAPTEGHPGLVVNFDGSGSSDLDGTIDSYAWDFGDGNFGSGATPSHAYTAEGNYTATLTVTDDDGSTGEASIPITIDPSPESSFFETGLVNAVTDSWQAVNLSNTYTAMVVIASVRLPDDLSVPAVARVRNAAGSSLELRVQSPSGGAITGYDVHYLAVEEGVYSEATHGVKMEAVRVTSVETAAKIGWTTEDRTYQNSYANPVVVGQVMTENDVAWSVFWASGASRSDPPSSAEFDAGKNVGEDSPARADETIGFLVLESGVGSIGDLTYSAQLSANIVEGVGNSSSGYPVPVSGLSQGIVAVVSAAGMNGGNGGWPVLFGPDPVSASQVTLSFDEDQVADAERSHIEEEVALVVFDRVGPANVSSPPEAVASATPQTGDAPLLVDFDGSGSTPGDGNIVSYYWDFGDGNTGSGMTTSHVYAASGTYTVSLTVTDDLGSNDVDSLSISVSGQMISDSGVVTGVGSTWQTVNLTNSYNSMVVIATVNLPDQGSLPAVARVRHAAGSSFELRVQNPSEASLSGYDVHYFAIEEGVYTEVDDGIKMEAIRVDSVETAFKSNWLLEARAYQNSYASPVVVGQVMSENDVRWSVFWGAGSNRVDPPSATEFSAGKHDAEDTEVARFTETIGYVVLEEGSGSIGGLEYHAAVSADSVRGVQNSSTGYAIPVTGLSQAAVAVVSPAGMDGNDGGWPVLFGANPVNASEIVVAVDEDQISGSERSHSTEQVAMLVFDISGAASPPVALNRGATPSVGDRPLMAGAAFPAPASVSVGASAAAQPDWQSLVLQTRPTSFDGRVPLVCQRLNDGSVILAYRNEILRPGLRFQVSGSANLMEWSPLGDLRATTVQVNQAGESAQTMLILPRPEQASLRFFRLEIIKADDRTTEE